MKVFLLVLVFPEICLPAQDLGSVAFLLCFLDAALRLIDHGEAGVGENVVTVDRDEPLRGFGGFFEATVVEESHPESMQGILIVGIDLEGLVVKANGLIQLVVSECIHGLLEKLFLCHWQIIAVRIRRLMVNIVTSSIHFPAGPRQAMGYLASSEDGGPRPGLLVLQEFWGLNDHIRDVTTRFAAEGFVALAPDMYDGKVTADATEARQLMMALDHAAGLEKLKGAIECLKANAQVAGEKIGVVGFCMGGFLALNLACNSADVHAVAALYGRIPSDSVLENLTAAVLYIFGQQDHHLPEADVDRLEHFIARTGRTGSVMRYPQADHAFFNDTRKEVYREADAKDAWIKVLAFLRTHL